MNPTDVRSLMMLAQKEAQNHIHRRKIGVDNHASFQVLYRARDVLRGTIREEHLYELIVSESEPDTEQSEGEGEEIAVLPEIWQAGREIDFRAVVRVGFMRNAEDYSVAFTAGFQCGTGGVYDED